MKEGYRPIFRMGAVQRYAQGKEKTVLPRFISPPIFRYLWILLGLLMVGCAITWFVYVGSI